MLIYYPTTISHKILPEYSATRAVIDVPTAQNTLAAFEQVAEEQCREDQKPLATLLETL
jgi:hypothetical protein